MPGAGGSSAQSIVAPFLDSYEQREEQSHQAFSTKICIMSLVTSCEVLYGKKICSTSCLLFFYGSVFSVSGAKPHELHLSMPY